MYVRIRPRVSLVVFVAVSLAAAGCAGKAANRVNVTTSGPTILEETGTPPVPEPAENQEPLISDWDHPLGDQSVPVANVNEAQELITSFTIYEPQGLGTPEIYVGTGRPPEAMVVIFRYESTPYGLLWIAETLPDIPDDSARLKAYEDIVDTNDLHYAQAEVVSVRQGITALITTSDNYAVRPTIIEWVQVGVQIAALGPTLSRDQAVDMANAI